MACLSAFCIALQIVRIIFTGTITYSFLAWNLLLAWVPLWFAIKTAQSASHLSFLVFAFLWFIFFPNAPYIITDFLHLRPHEDCPLWFDVMLLYAYSLAGLAPGILSVLIIYKQMQLRLPKLLAKSIILVVMFAAGYGIYLGRFLRLNSWYILIHPFTFICVTESRIFHPISHPRTYGVVIISGTLLSLLFLVMESFNGDLQAVHLHGIDSKKKGEP